MAGRVIRIGESVRAAGSFHAGVLLRWVGGVGVAAWTFVVEMTLGLADAIPFVAGWRERRREARGRKGAEPHVVARVRVLPPPLPADEPGIRRLPLPLRACQECGSPGVRSRGIGEGGFPGSGDLLDQAHCPRCGHEGLAVEFDRHEDYRSFLRRIALTREASLHQRP